MGKFDLKTIEAPLLTEGDYGRNLKQQFQNIHDNFEIVGNHDFVKGDAGTSVNYIDIPLLKLVNEDICFTEDGIEVVKKILASIGSNKSDSIDERSINEIRDYFKPNEIDVDVADSVNISKTDEPKFLSILDMFLPDQDSDKENWVNSFFKFRVLVHGETDAIASVNSFAFRDARFGKIVSGGNTNDYSNLMDATCSVYNKGTEITEENESGVTTTTITSNYEVINDLPSLYFDDSSNSFCWLISGQKTGLNAQGVKGESGKDSILYMAKVFSDNESNKNNTDQNISAYQIYDENDDNKWRAVTENDRDLEGSNFVVYRVMMEDNVPVSSKFCISKSLQFKSEDTGENNEKVCWFEFYVTDDQWIPSVLNSSDLEYILRDMNEGIGSGNENNSSLYGLHVPINNQDISNTYYGQRHMIWSQSDGKSVDRFKLHISPLDYYNWVQNGDNDVTYLKTTKNSKAPELHFDYDTIYFDNSDKKNPYKMKYVIGCNKNDLYYPLNNYAELKLGNVNKSNETNYIDLIVSEGQQSRITLASYNKGAQSNLYIKRAVDGAKKWQITCKGDGDNNGSSIYHDIEFEVASMIVKDHPNQSQSGQLKVSGATTLGSTLNVSGKSTLGETVIDSTLNVSSATTLGSTLNVSGAATFNGANGIKIGEALLNIDDSNNLKISNNPIVIDKSLTVSGATMFNELATFNKGLVFGSVQGIGKESSFPGVGSGNDYYTETNPQEISLTDTINSPIVKYICKINGANKIYLFSIEGTTFKIKLPNATSGTILELTVLITYHDKSIYDLIIDICNSSGNSIGKVGIPDDGSEPRVGEFKMMIIYENNNPRILFSSARHIRPQLSQQIYGWPSKLNNN